MHSVGGWGAVTTGKNLAMTLYELLGFDIRANPKYGSEKKGQPTTYFLSAAPEPIRLNCEYTYVDVVMSAGPERVHPFQPAAGLNRGGVFIIQSELDDPRRSGRAFPRRQRFIVDNDIRVFYVDGFKIAREEASNPELQFRMQGNAFQGAFFAASPLMERAGLDEEGLFRRSRTSCGTSSAPRASAWCRTTCAWCAAASTRSSRSPTAEGRSPASAGASRDRACRSC
jgi:pyruvate-ferredoxin/flavodoxin oxidoreductase